ncbi:MAG TPA: hypothetical protein VKA59_03375 [Vicinamibacterales bacterium]|nr:hypothetical protein [Vicinamibacterales bacterium]
MNGTVSRRVFVGSVAAGVPVVVGAGIAVRPFLASEEIAAQGSGQDRLVTELKQQLKDALGKMTKGQAEGAGQAAALLRVYAAFIDDTLLSATLKKANRAMVLSAERNHGEIVRIAGDLGINPAAIPPHHLIDRGMKELEFQRMTNDGLGPIFREVANQFDATATKLETLKRRGQSQLVSIALRQPIPTEEQCGHCNEEAKLVENCESAMAVACAAALIAPILAPACEGATVLYLAAVSNYGICMLYLQLCKAYYGN